MASLPLWLQIFLAILGSLGTLAGLVGGIYAARTSIRANREARAADTEEKAANWNAGYRAAAERHLPWDVAILSLLAEVRSEVNVLREAAGMEPHVFEPIPDKPPLFPEFTGAK